MNLDFTNWQHSYIGVAVARQPRLFGLMSRVVRIGIDLSQPRDLIKTNDDVLECQLTIDIFIDSPAISVCGSGFAVVTKSTRSISVQSKSGNIRISGNYSNDLRTIKGVADIRNFQLMKVVGTFLNCQIDLEAYEDHEP